MMEKSIILRTKFVLAASMMLCALMVSCSTMTKAEREAQEAERAKYVAKVLDKRHFTIDIDMMYPPRIGAVSVRSNWSLEVRGDTLVSYLPYAGVAYEASFGSNSGYNFTAPIKSYNDSGFKKGKRTIQLKARNEGDLIDYHLEVMDNGSTSVHVISRKRESISYSGEISEE